MNKHYDNFKELELTTKIKEVKEGYYAFEDTIFYGEKGGMLSDKGTINLLEVLDLKWEDDTLYHKVNGELSDPIHMKVDKHTRYVNTTVQSALHLLDGYYENQGLKLVAVGVNENNQWYEVNTKELELNHLENVQLFMNKCIEDHLPTEISYIKGGDYEDEFYAQFDELRIVKFGGINTQPCGTLHVNDTSDIMNFVILDSEKTSRGTRIYFTCNYVTNDTLVEDYKLIKTLAKSASCAKHELVDKVNDLVSSNKKMKKEMEELKKELLAYKADELLVTNETLISYSTNDPNTLRGISQSLMNKVTQNMIIYSEIENMIHLAIISCDNSARNILEAIKEKMNVTGGGSPKLVTVKTDAPKEELLSILKELGF